MFHSNFNINLSFTNRHQRSSALLGLDPMSYFTQHPAVLLLNLPKFPAILCQNMQLYIWIHFQKIGTSLLINFDKVFSSNTPLWTHANSIAKRHHHPTSMRTMFHTNLNMNLSEQISAPVDTIHLKQLLPQSIQVLFLHSLPNAPHRCVRCGIHRRSDPRFHFRQKSQGFGTKWTASRFPARLPLVTNEIEHFLCSAIRENRNFIATSFQISFWKAQNKYIYFQ